MKILSVLFLCLFSLQAHALTLELPDGESSDVEVYDGGDKNIETIYIHGKNSKPVIGPSEQMFNFVSGEGYTIYAPEMPWRRDKFRGTQKTANAIIDQLVEKIKSKGKRVVLIGHSLGASYAMIYAAHNGDKLAGVVPIAFAHVPQMSNLMAEVTGDSVAKANKMVAAGKGKETSDFNDLNKGEAYEIEATAEYFQSFYDPDVLPDASELVRKVTIPVLWISGRRDHLTDVYEHYALFETLPKNSKNQYEEIKGNHGSVIKFSKQTIVEWLDNL